MQCMKRVMQTYVLVILSMLSLNLHGQEWNEHTPNRDSSQFQEARLQIYQDPRLETLLQRHIVNNRQKGGMNGYRIQIFFGSGRTARDDANETKARFLSYFPDTKAHILYQSPFYKVRVGDFRTKNEALKFFHGIRRIFPNAYIIPDIIEFPDLED